MSQHELLRHTVAWLEASSIPYMITGSTVSSLQGSPRSTHDIDLIVHLQPASIPLLLKGFPSPDFYVDEDAVRDAVRTSFTFNILDNRFGDKLDFWLLKNEAFDQSRFNRRYRESAGDFEFYVSQPEDTILAKLKWAKDSGGSEKQLADCRNVFAVNLTNLDFEYLRHWSELLGVTDLLKRIQTSSPL